MNVDKQKVFSDFVLKEKVSEEIIEKYQDIVGNDVVEIWKEYGFGSTFKGYLKIVNPDEYLELLQETYVMPFDDIPVFVTGMGDIITCNSRKTINILDYRHQRINVLWTQNEIEWDYFTDDFYEDEWMWGPYFEAVEELGQPKFEECFGYEPLLSLGGNEDVSSLKLVNFEVYISIMGQMQGVLSC